MNKKITVVSGLPRSGTSMMMRMLAYGGMEIMKDEIRKADEDNPHGYFEFEAVKNIKQNHQWLDDAQGKTFKMVSMLLYDLPPDKSYHIIFLKRDLNEVLASQKKMLKRSGRSSDAADDIEMKALFENHLVQIEAWLKKQKNMHVLYVHFGEVLSNPQKNGEKINQFLGGPLDVEKMVKAVDTSLYRNKLK